MNVSRIVTLWIIAILSSLPSANVAFGLTPVNATAHIPYDFWIGGTRLPAGDYSVSAGAPSVVVFCNEKGDVGEQAFLVPTGSSVASGDCKLIFVVHDGKHYLRAIWLSDGKAILTSEFHLPLSADETETEIRLVEHKHDGEIVQTRR